MFLKMCRCLASVPQASKKALGQRPLRDPCKVGLSGFSKRRRFSVKPRDRIGCASPSLARVQKSHGGVNVSKGSRIACLAKCFCLEARGNKANKPHIFKQTLCFWPRRSRQGQTTSICLKMYGCLASMPLASKKTLGKTNTSGSL